MPKSVLITGCSAGGIGHALAREFHSRGLRVFATARKTAAIQDLADLGIETLSLEVTNAESITALAAEVSSRTDGTLDYLVNNAGRNYTVPALDGEIDEIRETFETNFFGVIRITQAFMPLLIQAKGAVVQIGSVAGVMPYVFGSVYNASKAALHSWSDTLRVEVAPFGVRVVTVVTAGVKSNIARTERDLKAGSLYVPVADEYQARLKHSQAQGIPNEQYAKYVVPLVLNRPSQDTIWAGGRSSIIYWTRLLLPRWVMDMAFSRIFNLAKLKAVKA